MANFSFRYFIIGNQSPGNLERVSNTIAVRIRKGTHARPNDLAEELRAISPDATFRSDFFLVMFKKSRTKIARYTLAKINNYLSRKSSAELITNPDAKQVNLEHILPQGLPAAWKAVFRNKVDAEDYVYRLGNMTLLTNKMNRTVADRSFRDKKTEGFDNSNLAINQYFRTVSQWTDEEIEARQQGLAKTALEVWKL